MLLLAIDSSHFKGCQIVSSVGDVNRDHHVATQEASNAQLMKEL